jgi:hypothetical protein
LKRLRAESPLGFGRILPQLGEGGRKAGMPAARTALTVPPRIPLCPKGPRVGCLGGVQDTQLPVGAIAANAFEEPGAQPLEVW